MWRLCCHYLFFVSPSFGASGLWFFLRILTYTFACCSLLLDGKICLQESSYDVTDYNERVQKLPASGEIYTLNEQCRLTLGKSSNFCSGLTVSIPLF